jgi:hypothetical protein
MTSQCGISCVSDAGLAIHPELTKFHGVVKNGIDGEVFHCVFNAKKRPSHERLVLRVGKGATPMLGNKTQIAQIFLLLPNVIYPSYPSVSG